MFVLGDGKPTCALVSFGVSRFGGEAGFWGRAFGG